VTTRARQRSTRRTPWSARLPDLAADVRGAGPPLLLLHGIGGTRRIWDPIVAPLAADHEVIAVDLPGFGDSAPLPDGATPDPQTLARALGELLDARGIARAHLAGSSLGAWIALELARLGRARSVTSLCAAGFWSRPLLGEGELARKPGRAIARALLPVMGPLLHTEAGRRVVLGMNMAHPERVTHAEALDIVRAYALAPGYPATNLAMRRAVFAGPAGIDVPVTLAWGERDRLVRPPRTPPPGWRTVVLPDCGHLPMWDDPPLVTRVIRETASAR
jgi:pimeloyl-ACP methyl ester carboxylesterase